MSHSVPAGNSPDLGSVTDEIIGEQLISTLPAPVQQHVKEQSKVDAAGTAKLADAFVHARPTPSAEFLSVSLGLTFSGPIPEFS